MIFTEHVLDSGAVPDDSTKRNLVMANFVLVFLIVGLYCYWVGKLATYNDSNFLEDQKQAKKDFF